jgi:D,D-heptose 1,7-bisphosphate phosphatase
MKVFPRQCAILVGGLGTRLGSLTAETPKPLLNCGDRPFLAWILRELSRFEISEVVLLAGHLSDEIANFAVDAARFLPKSIRIKLSREAMPAGTGGALWHARHLLDERFLLVNGDSWFDTNLARFLAGAVEMTDSLVCVLLRETEDTSRYGVVELSGRKIHNFYERSTTMSRGVINAGVYLVRRDALDFAGSICSFEKDMLPKLAQQGVLSGHVATGYFIDIGSPPDYARADLELPQRLHRPAVFFDRDAILNTDDGCVGSIERYHWNLGAQEAVRAVTEAGFHAFVVINQFGITRGYYSEADLEILHRWMIDEIHVSGGTIDDVRNCAARPEAHNPIYRENLDWCKPAPGMILDLASKWEIEFNRSFLVGDNEMGIEAAENAGIPGYRFSGGDVCKFVSRLLPTPSVPDVTVVR